MKKRATKILGEEELQMLRNPQVVKEIKESLKAFKEGKSKVFSV